MVKKMPSVFEPEGTALYVFLVIMLTFGNQSVSVDTETNNEALLLAKKSTAE